MPRGDQEEIILGQGDEIVCSSYLQCVKHELYGFIYIEVGPTNFLVFIDKS